MTWAIVDAEERNRAHPRFKLPPKARRYGLTPGDLAKLLFETDERDPRFPGASGERMWVLVESVEDNGRYHGTLNSKPAFMTGLRLTQSIVFDPKHVIQVDRIGCVDCDEVAPLFKREAELDDKGWGKRPHPQNASVTMRVCPGCMN